MEEEIQQVTSDLETLTQNPQTQISKSTLSLLQSLIDHSLLDRLSLTLSLSSLLPPLTSAMDSAPLSISLLASRTYLSLLLSPHAPVFTLFTPMAFLSLLRSLRRAFKNPNPSAVPPIKKKGKRKAAGSTSGSSRDGEDDEREREEGGFDIRVLFLVLERLELVLDLIHLDRFLDSLKSLIQTVAEMPVLGVELCGSGAYYSKLCDICSRILVNVLGPDHGDQSVTSSELLKMLTPAVFMVKSPARTFVLGFVTNRMMGMSKNSKEMKKEILKMPKYLALKAPEKAEPRALAVESIAEIVKALDYDDQIEFTEYVVKMSMGKSSLRLLSVDLILTLMMILSDPLGLNSEEQDENYWGLRCLDALTQRCSDSMAGIRSRALTNLAHLVGFLSGNDRNRAVLKDVLGFGNYDRMDELLRKRCADDKAAVRKASLLLISKLTCLLGGTFDEVVLKTMGMACADPLVSIRKAAISALSEAFRNFCDGSVTKEWLQSVPRLIGDNESSIQEECENLFLELVLDKVTRAGSTNLAHNNLETDTESIYPEGVLGILKEICNSDVAPWVKKICSSLGKKGKLKSRIAVALQNIIRVSESVWLSHSWPIEKWTAPPGAWLLLSEVSVYLPKAVDWEFLHHHWQLLDKNAPIGEVDNTLPQELEDEHLEKMDSNSIAWAIDRVFLLQTISNVSVELPAEPAADLAHNLLKRIEEFNMDTTEVNAHVKALRTLCKRKASDPNESDVLVMKWVNQLLINASEILDHYMSSEEKSKRDTSFLTPPSNRSRKGKKAALSMSTLLSKATTAVYTIGSLVIVCPTADMKAVVPVLHTIITSAHADSKLTKLPGPVDSIKQTAPSLYIQAWLTMGKICLADGKLAKRYIPLFVQELEKSDCAALRNNIIVMMADFCVHYTALVDCYISRITACLRDPCELVRRQTFILLSRLLQRDYVKWRGVLFLRFLLSLVDESEKIKHLADFLFGSILKVKSPLLAYNSFVEAIFVLNDCNALKGQGNSKSSKAENLLFSIRGNDEGSRSKRMHIYTSLLKQMSPEHLLATFAKVCAEVLASATDGMVNLEDSAGQSVLQDAFQILACKEIRIPSARGSSSDLGDVDEEGGDGGGAAAAAARGKVITQAVKKGLIQNTIPIFIELKRLLESKNSPLTGSLMECLRNILKEYKNEIDEMLVADKQLQKELIYDMQKYESQKPKSSSAEDASGSQRPNSSLLSPNEHRKVSDKPRSNLNHAPTPPLSAMSVPKLKSLINGQSGGVRPSAVLESLRRKCFDSDDES